MNIKSLPQSDSGDDDNNARSSEGADMLRSMPDEQRREMMQWLRERAAELGCSLDDDDEPAHEVKPEPVGYLHQGYCDAVAASLLVDINI